MCSYTKSATDQQMSNTYANNEKCPFFLMLTGIQNKNRCLLVIFEVRSYAAR